RRSARLDPDDRMLEITDVIDGGGHQVRLAYHFGPLVQVSLDGSVAELTWPDAPVPGAARMELPDGLRWTMHRGESDPILGWYSAGLGLREPAVTLVGAGSWTGERQLLTRLKFREIKESQSLRETLLAGSNVLNGQASANQMEAG